MPGDFDVQAVDAAQEPVAASGVDGGSFVLALPQGGPYRLEIVEAATGRVLPVLDAHGLPLGVEVCRVAETIELGPMLLMCDAEAVCFDLMQQMHECERVHAPQCEPLQRELDACRVRQRDVCQPEIAAFESCVDEVDCLTRGDDLHACLESTTCEPLEFELWDRCLAECRPLDEAIAAECGPPTLDPERRCAEAARVLDPTPVRPGCQGPR